MNYSLLVYPYQSCKFEDMNKADSEKYFQWFISSIEDRIKQLQKFVKLDDPSIILDYSPSSLISIWHWYETKIIIETKTEEEIEKSMDQRPEWMKEILIKNDKKVSMDTWAICMDVSVYFAEVFIKNNPKTHWGYFTKPKIRMSVNSPTILGFISDKDLNPRLILVNLTRKSCLEKSRTRLFDLYNTWATLVK